MTERGSTNLISEEHQTSVFYKTKRLSTKRETPFLVIDKKTISNNYDETRKALPSTRVFYAVKANADKRIINLLHAEGCGFEVSSHQEMKLALQCGVSSDQIISSNPLKSINFIKAAHQAGINYFAFDSKEEIAKLAEFAPGSNVYIRLSVPNDESEWPLSRKFGVEIEQSVQLLIEAARTSLIPCGITFHVGSQCIGMQPWIDAIKKSRQVWKQVKDKGLELKMLNIGGGFPIQHTQPVPPINEIAKIIQDMKKREFPENIEVFAEPGRSLIGDAGILVSTVIAKASRNEENWLYLDVGVFNGLMESLGGIQYSMSTEKDGPLQKWVVAGPSCDSMDLISNEVHLPEPEIGDKVYISPAGAYTTAYASQFNGISIPKIYFV